MKKVLIALAILGGLSVSAAQAQVELKTYADADGYIDVQKLSCALRISDSGVETGYYNHCKKE